MAGYKTDCPNPSCSGKNFYVTPDNGFGYCFNCQHSERDSDHKDSPKTVSTNVEAIRTLYTQAARYYHSALDKDAYAYLTQRGFNDKTIKDLQIGYCPTGKSPMYKGIIAKEAGLTTYDQSAFLANRITFPYLSEDGTVTDIRGRSLDPLDEQKYRSLLGSSYYRGALYPYNYHLHTTARRIILTEGEIKADIAYQLDYPTMALPGMNIWRSGFKPDANKEYILLYDTQRMNYHNVQSAIIKTAQRITGIKIATMPLMGKEKQDIDTFILTYGKAAFEMVINSALDFDVWYSLQRF